MITTTRCKFKCNQVTLHEGGKKDVDMTPVFSNDPKSENKAFWDATPSGGLKLTWINPNVSFTPGQEYYLDITPAVAVAEQTVSPPPSQL